MKVYWAALFLCIIAGICFLIDHPAYGSPLRADNERMELYLEKLQANIIEEEKAVESLKKRHEDILRKKQSPPGQGGSKEKNNQPDTSQSERAILESKLKDLETGQQALQQKNQELLSSLEQAAASIQKKDKALEELKKIWQEQFDEERRNQSALDTTYAKPRVDTKENEELEKNEENNPGIAKSILGEAKKIDSWWREKVW